MPSPRVPIFETVLKAWAEAFRAIRAMPVVAFFALVILAAAGIASWWGSVAFLLLPGRTVDEWLASPAWFVLSLVSSSLQIVLLAPLSIAVQRFVIRRDIARGYSLNPLKPSYSRYVAAALAVNLAYRSPDLLRILAPGGDMLPVGGVIAIWLLTLGLMITVLVVALRRIALFGAIAVGAPNATWRGIAPADAGNTFRIIAVVIGISLPGAIWGLLVHALLPLASGPNDVAGYVRALAIWLPQLPVICAFAAAAARIFMVIEAPAPATRADELAIA